MALKSSDAAAFYFVLGKRDLTLLEVIRRSRRGKITSCLFMSRVILGKGSRKLELEIDKSGKLYIKVFRESV